MELQKGETTSTLLEIQDSNLAALSSSADNEGGWRARKSKGHRPCCPCPCIQRQRQELLPTALQDAAYDLRKHGTSNPSKYCKRVSSVLAGSPDKPAGSAQLHATCGVGARCLLPCPS